LVKEQQQQELVQNNTMQEKQNKRKVRHKRIRSRMQGTKDIPRLCVFRSARYFYAQLINDETGTILASVSDAKKKTDAGVLGGDLAKKAVEQKIKKIVFDRAGYAYHGKVKAFAQGAREGGLQF
jgi:large subunit ribosomal protein L18